MSARLPQFVPAGRLADSGQTLRGTVELKTLLRLAAYLHDTEGEVDVELEFGTDTQRIRFVQGRLTTTLHLICQRCLQSLAYPLDIDVLLGLASSEAAAEALPERYDPLVLEEPQLDLCKLVEDELILAVPIVPMHADDHCRLDAQTFEEAAPGPADKDEVQRPFADLAELLAGRDKN